VTNVGAEGNGDRLLSERLWIYEANACRTGRLLAGGALLPIRELHPQSNVVLDVVVEVRLGCLEQLASLETGSPSWSVLGRVDSLS